MPIALCNSKAKQLTHFLLIVMIFIFYNFEKTLNYKYSEASVIRVTVYCYNDS